MKELKNRSMYREIELEGKEDGRHWITHQPTTDVNEMSAADLSRSQLPSHVEDKSAAVDQIVEI